MNNTMTEIMKANELRIGNWINEQGLEIQVGMITNELFIGSEPIPLTEEWLFRFGFEKTGDKWYSNSELEIEIELCKGFIQVVLGYTTITLDCDYVHTFQNAFFTLKGEELTTS